MFKKIFTYIQKNATGSNMFGNANDVSNDTEEVVATEATNINYEMAEEVKNGTVINVDDGDFLIAETSSTEEADFSNDDIELQIKQSIVIVNKSKQQSIAEFDDELADFAYAPPEPTNNSASEYQQEEEDFEKDFLELDAFHDKEVIVITDESDLNTSIISDNVSEDPLAIDDFNPLEHESDNPLEISSVANDETDPASADIIWLDNLNEYQHGTITSSHMKSLNGHHHRQLGQQQQQQDHETPNASNVSGNNVENNVPQTENAEELRSDGGSDSGLGSETSTLQTTINSIANTSQMTATPNQSPTQAMKQEKHKTTAVDDENTLSMEEKPTEPKKPLRSNLKRRLDDVEIDDALVDEAASTSTIGCTTMVGVTQQKRQKRSINFDTVEVYYFPRQQGFGCVPTAGGCTLGMGARHIAFKTLTLAEHAAELRRAHRLQVVTPRGSSSDETEESEEDYLSDGSTSDPDGESNGFIQPVSPKQRRALLKAAGVRKIDASEKKECRDIRNSREVCGCTCREFCDPETCACSLAGIKCQVDRAMFPCGCTREACLNPVGRVEFNPTRVRTHYIHTVMRLDLEQRQQQNPTNLGYSLSPNTTTGMNASSGVVSGNYYTIQPQSNYSSGYASPAYTPDTPANYYQQQQQQPEEQLTQTGYSTLGDLHTPPYQIDSLDSNLFVSGTNATPSYGELMQPTYPNVNYSNASGAQLPNYTPYHHHLHHQSTNNVASAYLEPAPPPTLSLTSGYSSCAEPSVRPIGNATTTVATAQYHHPTALETTSTMSNGAAATSATSTFLTSSNSKVTNLVNSRDIINVDNYLSLNSAITVSSSASCAAVASSKASNVLINRHTIDVDQYISLNLPLASSSRLSQINDLLHHNRNTTAALVAVSQSPSNIGFALNRSVDSTNSSITDTSQTSNQATTISAAAVAAAASIDTPPIEDAHKHCVAFDQLPPPLTNPTPIVAVLQQAHHTSLALKSSAPHTRQPLAAAYINQTKSTTSDVN